MTTMPNGPIYTASFASSALTSNPHDVFGLTPSSSSRVMVHQIVLTQPSSEGTDFGVMLLRGSTASSTSSAITPTHIHGWTGVPSAGTSVTSPCTTLVSTASASMIYSDATSELRWEYSPADRDRPILNVSQRLHVRITALTTARLNGTIVFSEIGKPAST